MVHGHDAIILISFQKDGVAREWSFNVNASFSRRLDSWSDMVNLLSTEIAILSIVRV